MSAQRQFTLVFAAALLGGGTWLLAQRSQDSPPRAEKQSPVYTISNSNNEAVMLDALRGRTWMLRNLENGQPIWLPVPRIDSEKEATSSWQRSPNYTTKERDKEKSTTLDSLLKERGYVAVPLKLLNTGHLCVTLRIEGKKVFVAVDTGAPITHFDLERIKHLQLKWQELGKEGDGKAPKMQATSWCEVKHLEIGGFDAGPLIVWGNDLSDINSGNAIYRAPQIDGLLGSDILGDLKAIIDYSANTLYIRSITPQK